jgi:hypothetical protein
MVKLKYSPDAPVCQWTSRKRSPDSENTHPFFHVLCRDGQLYFENASFVSLTSHTFVSRQGFHSTFVFWYVIHFRAFTRTVILFEGISLINIVVLRSLTVCSAPQVDLISSWPSVVEPLWNDSCQVCDSHSNDKLTLETLKCISSVALHHLNTIGIEFPEGNWQDRISNVGSCCVTPRLNWNVWPLFSWMDSMFRLDA